DRGSDARARSAAGPDDPRARVCGACDSRRCASPGLAVARRHGAAVVFDRLRRVRCVYWRALLLPDPEAMMFPQARWVSASALALLLATTVAHPARGAVQPAAPAGAAKLVVILVADQMRADYLERYSGRFTGGLRRLMQNGAWFQRAA